ESASLANSCLFRPKPSICFSPPVVLQSRYRMNYLFCALSLLSAFTGVPKQLVPETHFPSANYFFRQAELEVALVQLQSKVRLEDPPRRSPQGGQICSAVLL